MVRTSPISAKSPLKTFIALILVGLALAVAPRVALADEPAGSGLVPWQGDVRPFGDVARADAPTLLPPAAVLPEGESPSAGALSVEPRAVGDTVVVPVGAYYDEAFEVARLVNQERMRAGLQPLRMDEDLLNIAMCRAGESAVVFSHTRPDGTKCFTAGNFYAENIACGQTSAADVMNGWMNSPGHRANILTPGFTTIGVGCVVVDGSAFWSQAFGYGSGGADCPQPQNAVIGVRTYLTSGPIVDDYTGETYRLNPVLHPSSDLTLGIGQEEILSFTQVNPSFSWTEAILFGEGWTSSDSRVASVDDLGTVTGEGPGNARLTCNLGDFGFAKNVTVKNGVAVYRLYNPWTHEHLFTIDQSEYDKCGDIGWNQEGVEWYAPQTSSHPVYRLRNRYNGDHHYTTDKSEYDARIRDGWTGEGLKFYSADPTGIPIYRLFNPYNHGAGAHHYTTSASERDDLVRQGWDYENIGLYGVS